MAPPRILVVDDAPDVRELLCEALQLEGYTVASAADGAEALDDVRAHPDTALVVLDLMMPVMNGWRFCELLRADPTVAAIPVLVLSAVNQSMPHAPTGATLSLAKPVEIAQFIAMVTALVPRPS